MKESFDPQERLERYEKEAHELQTQIRFLEDEVGLLRRRLTNAPRQVKILEERLVQSRSDLSKALAQNVVGRGIRVNCVAPGPIWTPLQPTDKPADKVKTFGQDTPMGRPGQPEEVAPAFVFFASEADSSYISGEVLTILGGETRAS